MFMTISYEYVWLLILRITKIQSNLFTAVSSDWMYTEDEEIGDQKNIKQSCQWLCHVLEAALASLRP